MLTQTHWTTASLPIHSQSGWNWQMYYEKWSGIHSAQIKPSNENIPAMCPHERTQNGQSMLIRSLETVGRHHPCSPKLIFLAQFNTHTHTHKTDLCECKQRVSVFTFAHHARAVRAGFQSTYQNPYFQMVPKNSQVILEPSKYIIPWWHENIQGNFSPIFLHMVLASLISDNCSPKVYDMNVLWHRCWSFDWRNTHINTHTSHR